MDLYDNEQERLRHASAIQQLARELGVPVAEIGPVYEAALRNLKLTARVKDFLIILASRQVKARLDRGGGRRAPPVQRFTDSAEVRSRR